MRVTLDEVCTKATSKYAQKDLADMTGDYPVFGASGFIKNIGTYQQEKAYVAVVKDGAGIGRTMLLPGKSSVIGTMQYLLPKENIMPKFLYYAVKSMHLEKYYTGATIPHIYFKDYKKETFDLPEDTRQKEIINIFDKVELSIQARKLQLKALDELVKSRFVEMFGLPGTDSFGWGLQSLGHCCKINPSKKLDSRLKPALKISFIPMSAVSENGEIDTSNVKTYEEVKNGFTYFAEGDVLFAKITPCMENGKGAVAIGLHNKIGFGSTEFHVLRPVDKKSNSNWLYTVLSFDNFRWKAASNMTGSAGQRRVPASFLENYKISVPPIEVQDEFSNFLKRIHKSRLLFKCQLLQYYNIEHIIRGRNYG